MIDLSSLRLNELSQLSDATFDASMLTKKYLNLLLILAGSLFPFCSSHYNVPPDVKRQLETFGSNKKKFDFI